MTNEPGLAQGDEELVVEGESELASLLDAFGGDEPEPEQPDDGEQADDDEADAPEDDDSEDEESEDESEEDDEAPVDEEFNPKTASALEWYRVVRNNPQRFSEVPKRHREKVQGYVQEDYRIFSEALNTAVSQRDQALQRVNTLRELWEQEDFEAYREAEAKDPEAARIFQQMRLQQQAPQQANGENQIQQAAQQQLARLQGNPEAYERVGQQAASMSATPDALAQLTELVTTELSKAERGSKSSQKAKQVSDAAARRKSFPKAAVGSGSASGGRLSGDEFDKLTDEQKADLLFR